MSLKSAPTARTVTGELLLGGRLLGLVVLDRSLDGILCQHGAVKLHRRQVEMVGNFSVLDAGSIIDVHPFHPLGSYGAAGDGRPAPKGLEHCLLDHSVI
eukprot:CAMPEP_0184296880 /NCGR_PEP_ID=MMETSP1049-20130417/7826_1 /TAXON_ID=77928 /ORGANISM="Proteomonas sulcata, Strain CCMP704" /LENGTH=98 /DNA_ID=CAMNT_0026606329 /DNA_START=160 /DNA_END=456 /DNA_ORIENTATION=-